MSVGGLFRNMKLSNKQLMLMFYLICVPLRLTLAYLVTQYGTRIDILYGLLIIAFISVIMNMRSLMNRSSKVWWIREFHLYIGVVSVFVICGALLGTDNGREVLSKVLGGILTVDVLVGVGVSLSKKPFF